MYMESRQLKGHGAYFSSFQFISYSNRNLRSLQILSYTLEISLFIMHEVTVA